MHMQTDFTGNYCFLMSAVKCNYFPWFPLSKGKKVWKKEKITSG